MGSYLGRATFAGAVLAASPRAAEDRTERPAADSIEIEVSASGTAEVPAQGYQVTAFFFPGRQTGQTATGDDPAALTQQLEQLDMPDRKVCLPAYPLGFIGNELAVDTGDSLQQSEPDEEGADETQAANAPTLRVPGNYSGFFESRAAAERARALLQEGRPSTSSIQPVLFDCAEALEIAQLAALRKSQAEIELLARALGMRNAGVVRIEAGGGDQALVVFSALRSAESGGARDTVEAITSLKVTYRLER